MISAREADEIIRMRSFKSFEADYKVMLVWLPEAMNEEAANKILKILEEPWERTLFILVSERPDRLLSTIISRTQEVAVPRIAPEVLERVAVERGVSDPVQARNMARLAGGSLLELQHLAAGENDALRHDNFELFCNLMRLSYNDKHLELVTWAEEAAQLAREQQRAFLLDAARLLRESYISTPASRKSDTCGARSSPSVRSSLLSSIRPTSRRSSPKSSRPPPKSHRTATPPSS